MTIGRPFDNTYSKLSNTFKENIKPTPVHGPELVILNEELASILNLDFSKTDKVKEGIVFTTFHFPEHMVNMVTGHGKDEETMCAEYKVSSVEVQKISNQFKTEVKPKEHQAEVS